MLRNNEDYLKIEIKGSDDIAKIISRKYKDKYSLKFWYERQNRFILDYLKEFKISHLVEIGCGIGNFLVQAQSVFPRVSGVEPGPESLEFARLNAPKAEVRPGKGEALPFEDQSVDAIVMKGVVHHLKDPVPVFKEAYRCLKPGGTLVIFEGNRSSLYRKIVLGIADLLRYRHETTLFEHRSPKVMKKMLTDSKLETSYIKNVSGFFAPLALLGIGGKKTWKFFGWIEDIFQTVCPVFFNYYIFMAAVRPG